MFVGSGSVNVEWHESTPAVLCFASRRGTTLSSGSLLDCLSSLPEQ